MKLGRLNKLAFAVAILAGLGMTLVANFEIEKVCCLFSIYPLYKFRFSPFTRVVRYILPQG